VNTERRINWKPTLFFPLIALGAAAWPFHAWQHGVTLTQIVSFLVLSGVGGIGITVGYHRLFSHRAFECGPLTKLVLLAFGASTGSGSALKWAGDHLQHHRYADRELDPYSPRRGFWHAQMGWMFWHEIPRVPVPRSLGEDPLVAWQHRHYSWLAPLLGLALPALVGGMGGLLLAGCVRIVLLVELQGLINSWAHMGRHRPWGLESSASDSGLLAFLTMGEGWHSYHHRFPWDYRLGHRPGQWDPGKWFIWALHQVGLAWNLRRSSDASRRLAEAQGADAAPEAAIGTSTGSATRSS
jgi:stearoyl-CoA desaturase (Delta-9 desaturase)